MVVAIQVRYLFEEETFLQLQEGYGESQLQRQRDHLGAVFYPERYINMSNGRTAYHSYGYQHITGQGNGL